MIGLIKKDVLLMQSYLKKSAADHSNIFRPFADQRKLLFPCCVSAMYVFHPVLYAHKLR